LVKLPKHANFTVALDGVTIENWSVCGSVLAYQDYDLTVYSDTTDFY